MCDPIIVLSREISNIIAALHDINNIISFRCGSSTGVRVRGRHCSVSIKQVSILTPNRRLG